MTKLSPNTGSTCVASSWLPKKEKENKEQQSKTTNYIPMVVYIAIDIILKTQAGVVCNLTPTCNKDLQLLKSYCHHVENTSKTRQKNNPADFNKQIP